MLAIAPQPQIRQVSQSAWEIDRLATLPLITILVLLTNAPDVWYLRTPLIVLSVLALVYDSLRKAPQLWFMMTALLGITIYLNWESSDNHKYVIAYWCLTLCATFTVAAERQAETLERASRYLLGWIMLFATAWKALTPEYMNGTFFTYELLADERFARFAEVFGKISASDLADNRELRALLMHGFERGLELSSVTFNSTPQIHLLAALLTWWTVLIEGSLAILFLWPDSQRSGWIRNGTLLLFAISTYSVAPVRGFGWMLMLLGLAQCSDRDRGFRPLYLAAFLLIQIYTLPATDLLNALGLWR
jgi:hypothetical protein